MVSRDGKTDHMLFLRARRVSTHMPLLLMSTHPALGRPQCLASCQGRQRCVTYGIVTPESSRELVEYFDEQRTRQLAIRSVDRPSAASRNIWPAGCTRRGGIEYGRDGA